VSVVAVLSLILFLLGLVLGVSAMLHGTGRPVTPTVAPHEGRREHDPAPEPSPVANRASLDGSALPAATEVVIDRAEDGVAFAEPWAAVEQRP